MFSTWSREIRSCAKFEPLVKHANRVFKLHYTPHKELSIDESLIGRCVILA